MSERPRTMTAEREEKWRKVPAGFTVDDSYWPAVALREVFAELDAERAAHDSSEQQLEAMHALNKLRLDDCHELIQQIELAVAALDQIACYVPDTPQSFEKSLEVVTDIADKAHVAITAAMDAFNNKPGLAERAATQHDSSEQTIQRLEGELAQARNSEGKYRLAWGNIHSQVQRERELSDQIAAALKPFTIATYPVISTQSVIQAQAALAQYAAMRSYPALAASEPAARES